MAGICTHVRVFDILKYNKITKFINAFLANVISQYAASLGSVKDDGEALKNHIKS